MTNSTPDPCEERDSGKCHSQTNQVGIIQNQHEDLPLTSPTSLSSTSSRALAPMYTSPLCPAHALPFICNALAPFFSRSTLLRLQDLKFPEKSFLSESPAPLGAPRGLGTNLLCSCCHLSRLPHPQVTEHLRNKEPAVPVSAQHGVGGS